MGRIVTNCVNQLREMGVAGMEEPLEALLRQALGSASTSAASGAGSGAGSVRGEGGGGDGDGDDDRGGAGASLTLLGAVVAKLLGLIKWVAAVSLPSLSPPQPNRPHSISRSPARMRPQPCPLAVQPTHSPALSGVSLRRQVYSMRTPAVGPPPPPPSPTSVSRLALFVVAAVWSACAGRASVFPPAVPVRAP